MSDPSSKSARIFLVEDHETIRLVINSYLKKEADMEVVAEAQSAKEAIERLPELDVDLALVDLSLGDMSGIDLVGHLRKQIPDLLILVLTGHTEPEYARKSLDAGANGYVVKGDVQQIPMAVRVALQGETYLSPSVKDKIEKS